MPIKKRKIVVRKKRKAAASNADMLERMGDILAAGHGTEDDARAYFTLLFTDQLRRLQSIAAKAEEERNWEFMHGSYKQAAELYVLASVIYEKHPEHALLSDGAYDYLARFLLKNYDKTDKDFWDWYTISALDLEAGTGMNVTIQTPIRWMAYILTGEELPSDGATSRQRPRVLRKPAKRRGKPGTGTTGKPRRRTRRKSGSGGTPDKANKASKGGGQGAGKPRTPRRKPKKGSV